MKTKSISQQLVEKTYRELSSPRPPLSSRKPPVYSPFQIPALEKTTRQAQKTTGYKASASWQTASLLRDLLTLWIESLPPVSSPNLPLFSRLKAQLLDAARSVVANIEEGWARPSTKEFLDYLGFSQGSLTEVRGDIERCHADGILKSIPHSNLRSLSIPTPSRNLPYPPVASRHFPSKYGKLQAKLREFTGRNIKGNQLTYEIFLEFINKTSYLLTRTVTGLQNKLVTDTKNNLNRQLGSLYRKHC
jgi:hypothetical protein